MTTTDEELYAEVASVISETPEYALDAARAAVAAVRRHDAAQPPQPPASERFSRVAGRCPACRGSSLFLADGGHVTCSRLDCPNPTAANDWLEQPSAPAPDAPADDLAADLARLVADGRKVTFKPGIDAPIYVDVHGRGESILTKGNPAEAVRAALAALTEDPA